MSTKKNSIRETHGVGKAIKGSPIPPVQLHLLVTRGTGDVERYKLGEVPDLRYAALYRKKVMKVPMPKSLRGWAA